MADVMMAAGIDAAGDLDAELADLALALGIGEAAAEPLGDRESPAHWRGCNSPAPGRR